jgi:hypothetical protein
VFPNGDLTEVGEKVRVVVALLIVNAWPYSQHFRGYRYPVDRSNGSTSVERSIATLTFKFLMSDSNHCSVDLLLIHFI